MVPNPLGLAALALLLLLPRLRADAPVPPPPTLAQALAALGPPAANVVLAVDADKVTLPKDADPAVGQATTPLGVAVDFGLIAQDFGPVTAVAPATRTDLNADPADPDPYRDMGRDDLLPLLSASLTDAQWGALTGRDGVALADLTSDAQRQILAALFPDTRLRVQPAFTGSTREMPDGVVAAQNSGKPYAPSGLRDVTGDLPRARLRLGQKAAFMLPTAGGGYSGGGDDASRPHFSVFDDADAYAYGSPDPHPKDTLYGVRMAADVPNVLKNGDLDYDAAALRAAVPLAGLKTVGELVARIGALTRVELHADRRLAGLPLTVLGADRAAPASGLLRALALCLTGTYRAVGPAYVLTEDLAGAGVIHQRWADLQTRVMGQREQILEEARKSVAAHRSPSDLRGLGDPADLTDEQLARALRPGGVFEGDALYPPGTLFLPLDKLGPGQQEAARRLAAQMEEAAKLMPGLGKPGGLAGKVMLTVTPTWQLVLPSLDGPVTLGDLISVGNLFEYPPLGGPDAAGRHPPGGPDAGPPPVPRPPTLAAVFAPIPRRAVLAEVKTPQQVDSLVASARAVGLNQLWLVTFSGGVDHSALLAEALRAARGTGVAVFAVLDLLTWGAQTPDALRDRNVFGEDSAQANAHERQTEPDLQFSEEGVEFNLPPPDRIVADPANPDVRRTLTTLVRSLAARPGLAGLAWRADEPPGYDPLAGVNDDSDRKLGYDDVLRLAFLRSTHADPLDVAPNHNALPIDGLLWRGRADPEDFSAPEQWASFPAGANHALLGALYAAARSVAPALPLFVRQRHDAEIGTGWYGSWDDPRRPPPTYHSPQDQGPAGAAAATPPARDVQAKAQSRVSLTLMRGWPYSSAPALAQDVRDQMAGQRWDGFVLDFTQDALGPAGDPLATLAHTLAAPGGPKRQAP